MSQRRIFSLIIWLVLISSPGWSKGEEIPYGTGDWNTEELGNHRVILRVGGPADAVWAHIPWRRRDHHPEQKNIIVIDATTAKRISNVYRADINREFGDIVFQPGSIPGDYHVYYLPNRMEGRSNYPTITYPNPEDTADRDWLDKHNLSPSNPSYKGLPMVKVVEMQSIDEFNSFYPMEVIATAGETQALVANHPDADYLLFPEDRRYPIRMTDDLPYRWIKSGPRSIFTGTAFRGEFYAFQIGLYAVKRDIQDIDIVFPDLRGPSAVIPSSAFQSFNTEGVNWDGRAFKKTLPVPRGKVQPLWCGVTISPGTPSGEYSGKVLVKPDGMDFSQIELNLRISEEVLKDAGDSEPWRHSRLRWLNSTVAMDEEIVPPFSPVKVKNGIVSILGRTLDIGRDGLPARIRSYFNPEVTGIQESSRDILAAPFRFIVELMEGAWTPDADGKGGVSCTQPDSASWVFRNTSGPLTWEGTARMEFDGYVGFNIKLSTDSPVHLKDVRLEIPVVEDVAKYMMGMGHSGGFRPEKVQWKWDQSKNQDAVWLGDINAGLYASFRAENYSRPLNTNFYLSKPLQMPPSWSNAGKGGCNIEQTSPGTITVKMYSGERNLEPGKDLHFDFILLITPFKPIDTKLQWSTRFFHAFQPIDEIVVTGANTINNHHANDVNPYINYPFIHTQQMKVYVDEAHAKGMKMKIYYTIRELSNRAYELFALRSLGHEIFSPGQGGGFSWLQEHLNGDYIAAWFVPKLKDAAIINSGMSRWHNYYLEGLNWLAKNIGIDGLYIDDIAYDRTTMKRVRKILDRSREGALLDLHSANQFNPRDGFVNSALLYMEHFPYINRLWFGEYFDYDSKPDFWITELSGIPFGLMGEMLQDGGNPWRGMVYGMTARLPWGGDPGPIWKVWDDFGIQDSKMFGYWSERCPVKTGRSDVLATAYVRSDSVLISIASWADKKKEIDLSIDWEALGLNSKTAKLLAPEVKDFQPATIFDPKDKITMEPGRGWLLILR